MAARRLARHRGSGLVKSTLSKAELLLSAIWLVHTSRPWRDRYCPYAIRDCYFCILNFSVCHAVFYDKQPMTRLFTAGREISDSYDLVARVRRLLAIQSWHDIRVQ